MSSGEEVPHFLLKIIKVSIVIKYKGLDTHTHTHTHFFKENKIVMIPTFFKPAKRAKLMKFVLTV